MTLVESPEFGRHKQSLDALAARNPGYVYLISRFDDDDATICTFASMRYRDNAMTGLGGVQHVTLASPKKKARITRKDVVRDEFAWGSEKVAADQSIVENPRQGGGHAEELFLRKLPQMFDEYGEANKIDVFVSRIPCASESSHWILPTRKGDLLLPAGCANKLAAVIQANDGITWRIWWWQGYDNPNTQAACLAALSRLSGRAIVQQYPWPLPPPPRDFVVAFSGMPGDTVALRFSVRSTRQPDRVSKYTANANGRAVVRGFNPDQAEIQVEPWPTWSPVRFVPGTAYMLPGGRYTYSLKLA